MTPVLHVSREVADALPAGLSIAPVEARDYRCPRCGASFSLPLGTTCSDHAPVCVPSDLWGRIAVATPCLDCGGHGWDAEPHPSTGEPINPRPCRSCDALGALIVATATATGVLPVMHRDTCQLSLTDEHVCLGWIAHPVVHVHDDGFDDLDEYADALGLSPGQWVVTIEDWAPTTDRCPGCWGVGHGEPVYRLSIEVGGLDYLPCDACDGEESCPPVPVAAAPIGTITTWEGT